MYLHQLVSAVIMRYSILTLACIVKYTAMITGIINDITIVNIKNGDAVRKYSLLI